MQAGLTTQIRNPAFATFQKKTSWERGRTVPTLPLAESAFGAGDFAPTVKGARRGGVPKGVGFGTIQDDSGRAEETRLLPKQPQLIPSPSLSTFEFSARPAVLTGEGVSQKGRFRGSAKVLLNEGSNRF